MDMSDDNLPGDDSDIRTMDRRLLLNDPNTQLNHTKSVQREITRQHSQNGSDHVKYF